MDQEHNNIRKTNSEQFEPFQVDQEDQFLLQQPFCIDLAMKQIQLQQISSEQQQNNKNSTLLHMPASQIDLIFQGSNVQELTRSQRERADLQQDAKKFLIEESQHALKSTHFQLKLFKKLSQHPHSHNIQSFHQDELAQNKAKESIINKVRSDKSSNSYNLHLHPFRNRRMNILSRKDSQVKQSQQTRKITPPQQLLNTFLGKTNPPLNGHSGGNETEALGHKYLALQQQYNRKKPRIVSKSFHHRSKTQTPHLKDLSNNRNSQQKQLLEFYIRRLISPHTYSLTHFEQPSQQHLRSLSTFYHNFKPSNTHKDSRYSSDTTLNKNCSQQQIPSNAQAQYKKKIKSGGQLARQKIHNIFKRLKELRSKQPQVADLGLHQKIQINSNSLHNIHSDHPRQQAALNFHWNRERNKLRNASLKSQTIDFFKLSLRANKTQNEYISSALKTKKSKGRTVQYRTEPNQGQCAVISPIFLTNKQ